ncbi:MAG: hypothetical protein M1819_005579 [Sarea resinae]|nr:MAG: hypothetical protein M1819_005579 [Sarea resinae]
MASAEQVQALTHWAQSHGGSISPHVTLTSTPSHGSHLLVNTPLSAQTRVLNCPHTITLSYLNATATAPFQRHGPPFPDAFLRTLPAQTVTVFFLCQQYLLGEESFWAPYINVLPGPNEPDRLGTPLWFDEEDRLWLRGTNVEKGYQDREVEWERLWEEGCRILDKEHFDRTGYTWLLAKWAATILSSRSFISSLLLDALPQEQRDSNEISRTMKNNKDNTLQETFPVLFPLVDMLDHRGTAKIGWRTSEKELTLCTEEEVGAGGRIYNNYGPKSNEERYGFCLPSNPCDQFALRLRATATATAAAPSNPAASAETLYYVRPATHYTGGYPSPYPELRPFPPELLAIFARLVANEQELSTLNATSTSTSTSTSAPAPTPAPKNEPDTDPANPLFEPLSGLLSKHPRIHFALLSQLLLGLRQKHAGIAQHTSSLPRTPQTARQASAQLYRDGQLAILGSVIAGLEARLSAALVVVAARTPTPTPTERDELLDLGPAVAALSLLRPRLRTTFLRGLEDALGSGDVATLREAGWEEGVWVLWVAVAFICSRDLDGGRAGTATATGTGTGTAIAPLEDERNTTKEEEDEEGGEDQDARAAGPTAKTLRGFLDRLGTTYPFPLPIAIPLGQQNRQGELDHDDDDDDDDDDEEIAELSSLAQSFAFASTTTPLSSSSSSLQALSPAVLRWARHVVREEAFGVVLDAAEPEAETGGAGMLVVCLG